MTSINVANSIRRLEYEYNQLTDFCNKPYITYYFDSYFFKIHIIHIYQSSNNAMIINKIHFFIKRKNNKPLQHLLLNKILPHDISLQITNDFLNDSDSLSFQVDIEYDLLNFPFSPPFWNFIFINNNGFFQQTENDIIQLIHSHNKFLIREWNYNISLSRDLNLFVSELKTLLSTK
jgi:hypothetical protein